MLTTPEKLFTASNLCLLVYDYLITFPAEVSTVWSCPWSIGLSLFYINRYFPLIDETLLLYFGQHDLSSMQCAALFNGSLWMVVLSANCSHTIIYLQTCALWENNRIIKWFLLSLLIATFLCSVVLTALQTKTLTFLEPYDQPLLITPGCRAMIGHFYSAYVYIMVLVSQAFTVGLMLYKGVQHTRQSRSPWVIGLYRNGVLYCMVILLLSLGNAIIPNVPAWAITYANLLGPLQHTMESILCSRVMFVILKRRKSVSNRETGWDDAEGSVGMFTSVVDAPGTVDSSAIELESAPGKSLAMSSYSHLRK